MDQNTLSIYIHELRNLCHQAQASFDLFNNSVRSQQVTGVLFGGQMVLLPTSQIASLLWPTRARARSRGEKLREILQLPEKHALNDRRLSEIWERNDEKTDEWISNTRGDKVVFDFVGDLKQFGDDLKPEGIYRAYDPAGLTFYYRGVGYSFQAIANALSDIGSRVNAAYRQLFPETAQAEDEARAKAAAQAKQTAASEAKEVKAPQAEANAAEEKPQRAKRTRKKAETASKDAKPAAKKAAPKKAETKPATKKAPAKKTTARKPAAKKTPAKKKAAEKA